MVLAGQYCVYYMTYPASWFMTPDNVMLGKVRFGVVKSKILKFGSSVVQLLVICYQATVGLVVNIFVIAQGHCTRQLGQK